MMTICQSFSFETIHTARHMSITVATNNTSLYTDRTSLPDTPQCTKHRAMKERRKERALQQGTACVRADWLKK